ncbi:MAG: rhomboid family intramembrane serine protease [Nocardioidaceae bacterium]
MSGGVTGGRQDPQPDSESVPRCYRHTDRETYISCQRCGRPICPDCMRQASVGFQCPECVAQGRSSTPQARTAYGGSLRGSDNTVTLILIGINAAAFLLIQITGGRASQLVLETALINGQLPSSFGPLGQGVADGELWRLVTSMFVHVDLLHLFFNMFALWIFGPGLERLLGWGRFLALYLLSGLTGSVAVYWLSGAATLTYGASGAVFGLLGAALVMSVRRGYDVSWLLGLLGINLVFTFLVPNISWQGHLGGLLGGLALGAALAWAPRRLRTPLHAAAFVGVFVLCALLIVVRTAQLAPLL